jgi:D-alanyl-D-alanine carboxypeptidase
LIELDLDGSNILIPLSKASTIKGYVSGDLRQIPRWLTNNPSGFLLRQEALQALIAMGEAAKADGVQLVVASAYRSYEVQAANFQNAVRVYGSPEQANRYVARPGQPEHQMGTAVDFGGTSSDWKPAFAGTSQGSWLKANSYRFGFVLSYPQGMEHITGYTYEPWHFRYVGVEVARAITNSGLTPLEYFKLSIMNNPLSQRFYHKGNGQ